MKATTLGKQLLVALLATRERPDRYCGICINVHNNYTPDSGAYEPTDEDISKLVASYARRWPKYSGVSSYPVPHPRLPAEDAYELTEYMWDRETEYGRNRWELLDFIITEVEKDLQEDGIRQGLAEMNHEAPPAQGPVDVNVRLAIAPRLPIGPIDRSIRAARGVCMDNLNGTLTVSIDWLHDYSRLLLQQACEARLRSLGTIVSGGSTREAVEDFLKPNAGARGWL